MAAKIPVPWLSMAGPIGFTSLSLSHRHPISCLTIGLETTA